jgi:hypothetical protein
MTSVAFSENFYREVEEVKKVKKGTMKRLLYHVVTLENCRV